MTRWWAAMPRLGQQQLWRDVPGPDRAELMAVVSATAAEAQAVLRPGDPEAGYVSRVHSRDGKSCPCTERTSGAQPAWIWRGDQR